MNSNNRTKWISLIAVVILLFLIPLFVKSPYWMLVLTLMWIHIIVAESFRYIVTTGEYSFAHVPLMGMGGYASALLAMKLGLSFWLALPLGVLIAALISIIIYYPCLRTTGTFFFFASFAFGEVMRLCWVRFRVPFGGVGGLRDIPRPDAINIPGLPTVEFTFLSHVPYYYLMLVFMLFSLLIMYLLERSRLGAIAAAVKESKVLASFVGIRVWWYEMVIFVIASAFAALGGSLHAHYTTLLVPIAFYWGLGIYVCIWAVVGGTGHFTGPIVGTIVFSLVREFLRPIPQLVPMVYGLILAATLAFLPEGLVSLPSKILPWIEKGLAKVKER